VREHPGVLATKVGYFGVKSTHVQRLQMGTKPAKVGRLAPGVLKCGAAPTPHRRAPPQKGLRSTPRAKLLKSDRRRRLTKRSSLHKKRTSLRGRTNVAKVGPLRARVKSAKVRPTRLTPLQDPRPNPCINPHPASMPRPGGRVCARSRVVKGKLSRRRTPTRHATHTLYTLGRRQQLKITHTSTRRRQGCTCHRCSIQLR